MPPSRIDTERLVLRPWVANDREPFAALNADPQVMRWFPATLSRAASDALAERASEHVDRHGWGPWAAETRADGRFVGFIGLMPVPAELPVAGGVEIAWRLARRAWGHGLATEGARAALDFAFGTLGLDEVVSFTALGNRRSWRVMERLGMRREPATFEHPALPAGHPLRTHYLYRLRRAQRPRAAPGDSPVLRRPR